MVCVCAEDLYYRMESVEEHTLDVARYGWLASWPLQ